MDRLTGTKLGTGAGLMTLAGLAFVGYGVVFFFRTFFGSGFELGVDTLGGVTAGELAAANPAIASYIDHLHVAVSGLLIAAGIGVAALAWYGVRSGQVWAWATAIVMPVVALGFALPMHYFDLFAHDWVSHLGPLYLATGVFLVGVVLSGLGLRARRPNAQPRS
ncbi:hypothetical protein [Halorientalis pallida]|uniref:Uncharacterized protein n=1 Tax=Halorientalis pallida TaxID=2479928 RepID=A0A498KYE2_9EURY|nr:hypothetical protein [Halorientalis pallida]RXK50610.1 hypothetical protein EAF64_08675 [Halorientalis pallida]